MVNEYKIAKGTSFADFEANLDEFEKNVNKLIADGWELYGNVFSDGLCICQPMVRRMKNEKTNEKAPQREAVEELRKKILESKKKSEDSSGRFIEK